jgi:hypothetical protein
MRCLGPQVKRVTGLSDKTATMRNKIRTALMRDIDQLAA